MMNYHRISSPVTKVLWAGWESDTLRLQQAGWEVSAEQSIERLNYRFAFKHPNYRIYGLTNLIKYDNFYDAYMHGQFVNELPPLTIQYMASRMEIRLLDNLTKFQPVDCVPNLSINEQIKSIEDFMIFRPIAKEGEIIVAPETVPELLDLIIKKQDPKQKELRELKRKQWRQFTREINEGTVVNFEQEFDPRKNIVAQLITV